MLESLGRTKEIESEHHLWKTSLVTCGKQFPSEALVSYCLNFFNSFKTGQSTNTSVIEGCCPLAGQAHRGFVTLVTAVGAVMVETHC